MTSIFQTVLAFSTLAAVTRFILRDIETRWQIVTFWLIAAAWEWVVKPMCKGANPSATTFFAATIGITIASSCVKWSIEGISKPW
jgi:hypothetical protein